MSTQVLPHAHNGDQTQQQSPERKKGLWSRLKKKFHTKPPEDVETMFPALFGRALSGNQTSNNSGERTGNFIASLPQQPAEQRILAASLLTELDQYERLQRRSYRNLPPLRFHVRIVRNVNGQTQRVHTVLNAAQLREKLVNILNSTSTDGRTTQNLFADFMTSGTTTAPVRRSVVDVKIYPSYKYTGLPLPEDKKACAICLADYEIDEEIKTIPCMHFYHQACIDEWMSRSCVCPICKSTIGR